MRPLRGALVGFGFIAEQGHLPAYADLSRADGRLSVVAVADTCAARRDRARRVIPGVRVYEDHRALLAAEATQLDFLDVCTPPCDHAGIAHDGLDRGLHVLCEKPLATTTPDARAMLEHAVRARRVLFPSHNYKHAPVIKAVRRVLDAGVIGQAHLVTLQTFRSTHARGVPEWRPDWRREQRLAGGGIAMDHGTHTFYLAFEWLRSYPTAITAKTTNGGAWDTEDSLSCSIAFPTGLATAQLTWTAGFRKVLYTIHGERGAVRVEDSDLEVSVMGDARCGRRVAEVTRERIASDWDDAGHARWFGSLFGQFAEAVERGDFAGQEARDSLRCVEVIEHAYQSARDGSREVPLGLELLRQGAA